MKIKTFFLLSASLIILSGCGDEEKETENKGSGESMGTLNPESEEENSTESNESAPDDSEENQESEEKTTHDSGLLDLDNTEAGWINFEGELGGNSDYHTTSPVEYNPNQNYVLTKGGYIAYYKSEEFIKTIQQTADEPIEQVQGADSIRVSYHSSFRNSIALNEQ